MEHPTGRPCVLNIPGEQKLSGRHPERPFQSLLARRERNSTIRVATVAAMIAIVQDSTP